MVSGSRSSVLFLLCRWLSTIAASRLCAFSTAEKSPLKCRLISACATMRAPAAGRTALHAEHGAERWLAQHRDRALPEPLQPIGEADRRRGLALARRRGRDRRDQDQLRARRARQIDAGGAQVCVA